MESLNSGQSAYINNAPSTFTATVTGNSWQGGTSGTINFDLPGGAGGANYAGQGAYSDPGDNYWNAIVANGTTPAGTNSDGVTLNTITFTEAQTGQFQGGTYTTEGTPQALEYYYADVTSSATNTCTLNHVPAGTYNLYLYGINGGIGGTRSDRGTTFTVSSDSTPATSQSTVNTSSGFTSFIQGNSYVLFTNILVGTGATITFTYSHNPNATNTVSPQTEGDFNGLQLQSQ